MSACGRNVQLEQKYHYSLVTAKEIPVKFKFIRELNSEKALSLWHFCEKKAKKHICFFRKLKNISKYKILDFYFYRISPEKQINLCQLQYYKAKICELKDEIKKLEKILNEFSFDNQMKNHEKLSMALFKHYLAKKYKNLKRTVFELDDLWKKSAQVIDQYPLILSTTYSLRSSLSYHQIYDYVIIDESSQVDIATGMLAFSCAKKAVIVGDTKQLNHIVAREHREEIELLFKKSFQIKEAYNYNNYNILSSVTTLDKKIPITLLKEHYRCHPKIINFCNAKFYNNRGSCKILKS